MQLVTGTVIGNMLLGLAGGDVKALARNLGRQAKGSPKELLQSSLAGWASSRGKGSRQQPSTTISLERVKTSYSTTDIIGYT